MRRRDPILCPNNAETVWNGAQSSASVTVTARCTLITPMYGGGVTPGEIDRDMPIRASAIRGQLRFWWRLLNGTGKASQNLFMEESALWGGISASGRPRASQVTVQVKSAPAKTHQLEAKDQFSNFPTYALIPNPGTNPKLLKPGYSFDLVLQFAGKITPLQREQVIEALRWWADFSGVGARTRRGLGAVKVASNDVCLAPVCDAEVSCKDGTMVLRGGCNNAVRAWREAVDKLRDFRQGQGVGRDPGHGFHPGRSRWPEADTIRRLVPQPTAHTPVHPVNGFYPRAAFGLPIVFHFKDHLDPDDRTLEPEGHDRMASPLILRPYFDGESYRPLALLLPGWKDRVSVDVRFGAGAATPAWPDSALATDRSSLADCIVPMQGRGTDALSAFMDYFSC